MVQLVLGLVIFIGGHVFTTLRSRRGALIERTGEGAYKGLYSLVALVGLALIVHGFGAYRSGGYIDVWNPPTFLRHLVLLLMWPAMVALVATYSPGLIKAKLKHPMLVAVKIWALAHLLANGDLGSILLFGSFLAWAVYARIAAKRRGAPMLPADTPFGRGDVIALVVGTIAYLARIFAHPYVIGVPVIG